MLERPTAQLGTLSAHDGLPLRTAVWPAPPGGARGTVVLLQGRAEFIEKYGETVDDLRARGFAVYALDWRGQGRSGRVLKDSRKGHVVSYEDYLSDLDLFLERLVVAQAPRPIMVLAHSMGGHIVLRHRAEHDSRAAPYFAAGIVLSAPMVDILMNPAERALGAVLTVAAMSVGLRNQYVPVRGPFPPPFDRNPLTRDRARYERMETLMRENPALAIDWPTVGWLAATRRSVAILRSPGLSRTGRDAGFDDQRSRRQGRFERRAGPARRAAARLPAGDDPRRPPRAADGDGRCQGARLRPLRRVRGRNTRPRGSV